MEVVNEMEILINSTKYKTRQQREEIKLLLITPNYAILHVPQQSGEYDTKPFLR